MSLTKPTLLIRFLVSLILYLFEKFCIKSLKARNFQNDKKDWIDNKT